MEVVKKKRAPRKKPDLAVVLEEGFEVPVSSSELPEFTAVGLVRFKDNTYSQVTVTVNGEQAKVIDLDEPNLRPIAIDSFKIAAMKKVIDAGTL